MIPYKTLKELQAHKVMIINNLVKEYMVDYHLSYQDALTCAQKEYDIKEDVVSHNYKEPTKKRVEKYVDSMAQSRSKNGLTTLIDPFTKKIYFSRMALLRAYGLSDYSARFKGYLQREKGNLKKALLHFDEIAALYPNEERPLIVAESRIKYKEVKDHKGRVFHGLKELGAFYKISYKQLYYYVFRKEIDITEITRRLENGTLYEIKNIRSGYKRVIKK